MDNKKIQEQRMKSYFINAAKGIIKSEGLSNISTRNIANEAGYSYATLYNYFKDVKELIFYCVQDFQAEGETFIEGKVKDSPEGLEKIKGIARGYVKFFLEYPNYFELFFLEKLSDVSSAKPTAQLITGFLDKLSNASWEYCIAEKIYSKDESAIKKAQLNYVITGALLLYLNRKTPESYTDFLTMVDKQIQDIVG